jgi:hypothetical protein
MSLPGACSKPCNDCPWRKTSARGWLGPMPAADWIRLASSDEPIACHATIDADENGDGDWSNPRMRQCKGAAIYRRNTGKSPRNADDARHSSEPDREHIFTSPKDFMEHHRASMEDLFTSPAPVTWVAPLPPTDNREDPCDGCEPEEAAWQCPRCSGRYCDDCIDAAGAVCPECLRDPGWIDLDNEDEVW